MKIPFSRHVRIQCVIHINGVIILKKKLLIFPLAVILLICPSCTESVKTDWNGLSERLENIDGKYAFDWFDMIFYDNAYHVFLSLDGKDDAVLSMTEEDGVITSVTLTSSSKNLGEASYDVYAKAVKDIMKAYTMQNDDEISKTAEALGTDLTADYFHETYTTYTSGRYNCSFSSNSLFIAFCCEYFEAEELSH